MRRLIEGTKKYRPHRLGVADDHQDANGLDVLDFFQQDGPGWQERINAALRKAVGK